MIVLLLHFCVVPHMSYAMENFEGFSAYQEHAEQSCNSLEFFGELSSKTVFDDLKKKRDAEGNSLLHVVASTKSPNENLIQILVIDHRFSVLEKNLDDEDVWFYGMRFHKADPYFFRNFDLLYHGPTKIQWQALCGETQAVHDALDERPEALFEHDQRGFPLIYYAWRNKTLLKQLLEKKALSDADPETYKKVMDMWFFRGQQEAKCSQSKEHKKIIEAIKIVFAFSKGLLKAYGDQFAQRAAFVDRDLLVAIFERLALDQGSARSLLDKVRLRVVEERKKELNSYYSGVLLQTYTYLASA